MTQQLGFPVHPAVRRSKERTSCTSDWHLRYSKLNVTNRVVNQAERTRVRDSHKGLEAIRLVQPDAPGCGDKMVHPCELGEKLRN